MEEQKFHYLENTLNSACGLWAFSSSFINGILTITMGPIGPVLYSTSNKLKALLSAPVKGYGRALMSVTGHLFGGHEFDELNEMYKYALKIMLSIPFSIISSKMLDGFGKSMYSLLFTCIKIGLETGLIYVLNNMLSNGSCVLIGITITEIIFAIVYYVFLRYLFNNFDEKYENKEVVKTFKSDNELEFLKEGGKIKDNGANKNKTLKKILLNIALIALIIGVIWIVLSPISVNNYPIFIGGIICLAICTVSIYLITSSCIVMVMNLFFGLSLLRFL